VPGVPTGTPIAMPRAAAASEMPCPPLHPDRRRPPAAPAPIRLGRAGAVHHAHEVTRLVDDGFERCFEGCLHTSHPFPHSSSTPTLLSPTGPPPPPALSTTIHCCGYNPSRHDLQAAKRRRAAATGRGGDLPRLRTRGACAVHGEPLPRCLLPGCLFPGCLRVPQVMAARHGRREALQWPPGSQGALPRRALLRACAHRCARWRCGVPEHQV
jgi:hypothetical protein